MHVDEIKVLTERLIPVPRSISFLDGQEYLIAGGCAVNLPTRLSNAPVERIASLFKAYWQVKPEIHIEANRQGDKRAPEAYAIKVAAKELAIEADDEAGFLNAMKTLRQLAEVCRGTSQVTGHFLVQCEIEDEPAMAFRGVHLCIFPETPLWDIERQVRLAAYHKYNYAVIESWGVFPFETHPEFCWKEHAIDKAELKRIIALGRELGITLIPQFNLLGHATASRSVTGKHVALDFNPALQPLFEPEGWTWCLSNPNVRSILSDIVNELCDFFENPPFFHIGCDEADNIGTCRDCRRQELKTLVKEHILHFHDLLQKRGIRTIMWHDMLVERGDPRWKGYTAYGLPRHNLSQLYRELPRDIVIADWQYSYRSNDDCTEYTWPTARFFHKENFNVLMCPWLDEKFMASQGRLVAEEKLLGMLETTWHKSHDRPFATIYGTAPCIAWNPFVPKSISIELRLSVAHHLRQIGWDMNLKEYAKTGFSQYQVDPGHHPHQLV